MAELAREIVTPGPGQCLLHVIRSGPADVAGRIFVERADPVVAMSEDLISQIRSGTGHPDCHLDGSVLTIDGANQRVAYRLERCGQPGYLLGRLA